MSDQLTHTWNTFCNRAASVQRTQAQLTGEIGAIASECAAIVRRNLEQAEAGALTKEYAQRSTRRVDSGREPIESSPLFGGAQQTELF